MGMSPYILEETIKAVEEAVEKHGANRTLDNGGCFYYRMDTSVRPTPVCLVGQVLDKFGLLDLIAPRSNGVTFNAKATRDLEEVRERFTPDALAFLDAVQYVQDGGGTWGEALKYGKEQVSG